MLLKYGFKKMPPSKIYKSLSMNHTHFGFFEASLRNGTNNAHSFKVRSGSASDSLCGIVKEVYFNCSAADNDFPKIL